MRRHLKTLWKKGENAGHQHFLLFSTMFSTLPKQNSHFFIKSILSSTKILLFRKELKSQPNDRISQLSKLKAFADGKLMNLK